ncbi:hypothetical protein ACLOJK_029683 [Asimina triloba]
MRDALRNGNSVRMKMPWMSRRLAVGDRVAMDRCWRFVWVAMVDRGWDRPRFGASRLMLDRDLPGWAPLLLETGGHACRSAIAGRWRFGDALTGRSLPICWIVVGADDVGFEELVRTVAAPGWKKWWNTTSVLEDLLLHQMGFVTAWCLVQKLLQIVAASGGPRFGLLAQKNLPDLGMLLPGISMAVALVSFDLCRWAMPRLINLGLPPAVIACLWPVGLKTRCLRWGRSRTPW